jgi:DNA-binding transcriptional MerR regulator
MRAGVSYRQLDYWIRMGAITLADTSSGTGYYRQFTLGEAADVESIGALIRRVTAAGLDVRIQAIEAMWHGLQAGEGWRLVLDVDDEP